MRPFLPPLLAGALAGGDIGLDFDGTGFAFLESTIFLAGVLALAVAAYAAERLRQRAGARGGVESGGGGGGADRTGGARDPLTLVLGVAAVVLGALLFAGSLDAGNVEPWPGYPAGAACALLGAVAVGGLLARVRRRLDASAATLVPVWADAAALLLAAVAILFPPAALIGLAALAYLLLAGLRSGEQKYEGLRILR